jgi:hypothetical protein
MAVHPNFSWARFGRDLRAAREACNLGLREAARKQKIDKGAWCRAEMGKPVTVPTFLRLCLWMDADPFAYDNKR